MVSHLSLGISINDNQDLTETISNSYSKDRVEDRWYLCNFIKDTMLTRQKGLHHEDGRMPRVNALQSFTFHPLIPFSTGNSAN